MQEALIAATESYVAETMHATLELSPWPGAQALPPYLRNSYRILQGHVGGRRVLWLFTRDELTPAAIEKHASSLAERWPEAQVVVFERLPSYVRRRLIERGIAFVVPGTQLYLPDFGVDFRSRVRQSAEVRDTLRPSAQAMLLYLLLRDMDSAIPRSASALAPVLGQTLMTASRAVAELDSHGLVSTHKEGRTKEVRLSRGRRATWDAAQDVLRTPVKRRLAVGEDRVAEHGLLLAGLSALSHRSMLAEPSARTYAVFHNTAKSLESDVTVTSPSLAVADEPGMAVVEVWTYDPRPLAVANIVDPLSLHLSLREDEDERVEGALRQMMEEFSW